MEPMLSETPYTAHVDTFARDHLPPARLQPEYLFERPELQFPARLNCAAELLDRWVRGGQGGRVCLRASSGSVWTYADLLAHANRIAHVLVDDMGLVPGNRVLLRAPNTPMLVACWFGVIKAGGIKQLAQVISKGAVTHVLCDKALLAELALAMGWCPTLRQVRTFLDTKK
jgi:2-aminobenzoate-CoA ligase